MLGLDELPQPLAGAHRAHFGDGVADVRPVEAGNKAVRLLQPQLGDDLLTRALVRRCRQRDARHVGEALGQNLELAILGPEVVAPLRDAVRLVDGKQCNVVAREKRQRAVLQQPLRRDVQEIEIAGREAPLDFVLLAAIQRRVQKRGTDAGFLQGVDLILHQRDERRHDDAGAGRTRAGI